MADYPQPILTVDVVVLTLQPAGLAVGLIRRDADPFRGAMALPGGYVHADADADTLATARRVLRTKAGLDGIFCEQLATFSGPTRDPRGWSATVAYYALVPTALVSPPRSTFQFVSADQPGPLVFDHNEIIKAALERLRGKGAYSTLPAFLLPETFTLPQLRAVYERVMGTPLNDSAFRRKIDDLDVLEVVPDAKSKASARPATLFRLKAASLTAFDRRV
jgi:8-oxo-dGTP diphosphatase